MKAKDRGANKAAKKRPSSSIKEKRQAKQAKRAASTAASATAIPK
jgi:hypothetical protein